jgi:hypothetical protein
MTPAKRDGDHEKAPGKDPVKRRWVILGGTIIALATGVGGGAGAAAADTEGAQSAPASVVRIHPPQPRRPAGTDSAPGADDPEAPAAGGSDHQALANRLGRFMG